MLVIEQWRFYEAAELCENCGLFIVVESTSLFIPQPMITTLDALLVEGDLLEINVGEKESLRAVLRNCRPDNYCLFVFVPLVSNACHIVFEHE